MKFVFIIILLLTIHSFNKPDIINNQTRRSINVFIIKHTVLLLTIVDTLPLHRWLIHRLFLKTVFL